MENSHVGVIYHGGWPRGVGGRHIDGIGVVVSGYVEAVNSEE